MRLLEHDNGGFSLISCDDDKIPLYAILSHTWGPEQDEVTFIDIVERTNEGKAGYRKLQFCAEQAAKDGLRYFWVDTCCIDKSNISELQKAINSMFRWYQNAAKCYVYLPDVSSCDSHINDWLPRPTWQLEFPKSRWFTRGWTLQELIAPRSVDFFSQEGDWLGDKNILAQQIHEITGISVQALRGCALSELSIEERFSWAKDRNTKEEEDSAYCLIGIFDVSLPLIYGEGQQKAFNRLRREIYSESHHEKTIYLQDKGNSLGPLNFFKSDFRC
jgi:hypothetical protein